MDDVMGLVRAADDRRLEELPEQQPSITPTATRDTFYCCGVSRSSQSQVTFMVLLFRGQRETTRRDRNEPPRAFLLSQPFSANWTQKVDPNMIN